MPKHSGSRLPCPLSAEYRRNVIDAKTGWYLVPATLKAVVIRDARVLLALNRRGEWELPGGWPTRSDGSIAQVIRRELLEEASLDVEVGPLVHAALAEVGGHQVVIVAYRCSCEPSEGLEPSDAVFIASMIATGMCEARCDGVQQSSFG